MNLTEIITRGSFLSYTEMILQKALYEGIVCYKKKSFYLNMAGAHFLIGIQEIKYPYVRGMVLPLD